MSANNLSNANGEVLDQKDKVLTIAGRVRSAFVLLPSQDYFFNPLTERISLVSEPFKEIGKALQANLDGLLASVAIPFTLAHRSAVNFHWHRIHTAARIRSISLTGDYPKDETPEGLKSRLEREDSEALANAKPAMDKFVSSKDGVDAIARDTLTFLDRLHSDQSIVGAANELILQGLVLCWGAFEVLARDSFVMYLNVKPDRTLALIEDSVAKRRFELSKVSLETLAAHKFNLSTSMGTLLAEQQDLSDVISVKAVFRALFPNNQELRDALDDNDLRLLSLRRNLTVHRRGIIDSKYTDASDCSQHVGQRLMITPDQLETHIRTTIKTATRILAAVND